MKRAATLVLSIALGAGCAHRAAPMPPAPPRSPLAVRVSVGPTMAAAGVSGRLIVLMAPGDDVRALDRPPFLPGGPRMAAAEVSFAPGGAASFELPADAPSFPTPLREAPAGSYVFQAILDRNHDFAYAMDARDGDLISEPVVVRDLDPAAAGAVNLALDKETPTLAIAETDEIKWVEISSALLSAFWARPVSLRAAVVLPASYGQDPARRWPAVYQIHGFSGSADVVFRVSPARRKNLLSEWSEMVVVMLDATCSLGHHAFADSVNDGPWGRALVEELIPELERRFRLDARPAARFLNGHSSGGWSSLWIQVSHPDDFGGTWSSAPDPVDFRDFTGIDATPGSRDNAFHGAAGAPHSLMRMNGKEIFSFEQWSRLEAVTGEYGGQLASFDAVFSPRGADGRPLRMFDHTTGRLDPIALEAWRHYDIRRLLERDWATLEAKLAGKLHVFTGAEDTFHLDGATRLLCEFLTTHKADAECAIVPGRNHFDLGQPDPDRWPDGMQKKFHDEMIARYRASLAPPPKPAEPPAPAPSGKQKPPAPPGKAKSPAPKATPHAKVGR